MAIASYLRLRQLVLRYLGRPGDLLIDNDIPDMVRLFEVFADRELKTRWQETSADLLPEEGDQVVDLPSDFRELRSIHMTSDGGTIMRYLTPDQVRATSGEFFSIEGLQLRLADPAGAGTVVRILYMQGIMPLSGAVPTNWLLANHPDAYLFGTLAEAEMFLGNDDRVSAWLKRRDAALLSIINSDIEARWGGGGLQMRPEWQIPGVV